MRILNWLMGMAALLWAGCHGVPYESADRADWVDRDGFVLVWSDPAAAKTVVYGRPELAGRRYPPCSTFKIVSTLMGLEAGVVTGLDSRLGYDGMKHEYAAWNHDVTLEEAFRTSCVWYYKKMIGRLDKAGVQRVLNRLAYGNCDISVWNSNGHNVFWIESSLLISPFEQIAVLRKIFSGHAGFNSLQLDRLQQCMRYDDIGTIRFYGKTGTGRNHCTNRLEAWCVGFLEYPDGRIVYYAAHGADPERDVASSRLRDSIRRLVAEHPPV